MNLDAQISNYIISQPESKSIELLQLHDEIVALMPSCKHWFFDGKDENGKVISNPNIGYGQYTIQYAGGKTREFYQIGLSANTTGISVYIMGLNDKSYLQNKYGDALGKASITGYCIKFKTLKNIHLDVLKKAILDGVDQTSK